MGKWYTEEEKHRAIRMRKAGVRPEVIRDTLGANRSLAAVRQLLVAANEEYPALKRSNNKYDKDYVAAWERRWTAGETLTAIAKEEGVSTSFVSQKISKWFYDELA